MFFLYTEEFLKKRYLYTLKNLVVSIVFERMSHMRDYKPKPLKQSLHRIIFFPKFGNLLWSFTLLWK